MQIPTLTTKRLILRAFTPQDVNALQRVLSDPQVHRYFPRTEPPSREQVERIIVQQLSHWEKHGCGWWAVLWRESQELIGWCGLQFLPEFGETEVAYLLSRPHWGKGLATEAAQAAVQFGFQTLGLERIVAIAHVENAASQRVIEKLGMSFMERLHLWGMECYRYSLPRASFAGPATTNVQGEDKMEGQEHTRPAIHFERITARTVRQICKLSETLAPQQRKMVADNADSIAQAHFSESAWLRAIYADDTPIGLLMLHIGSDYADGIDCPGVFLWRFMIAGPFQSKGYGRQAIEFLFAHLKALGVPELYTSYGLGEASPEGFYQKLGFVPTGGMYGDEVEAVCRINSSTPEQGGEK